MKVELGSWNTHVQVYKIVPMLFVSGKNVSN